jgi:tRNA nucleotidyltransferase/poly(A) polymerase
MEGILADLNRRDFTVNAMGISFPEGKLLDPHNGAEDLDRRVLRGVGDARQRFREDPLRTLRAGRFISTYGFTLEPQTLEALKDEFHGLNRVAPERIREELLKLVMGEHVVKAYMLMASSGVFHEIVPEFYPEPAHREGQSQDLSVEGYEIVARMILSTPKRASVRMAAFLAGASLFFNDIMDPLLPAEKAPVNSATLEARASGVLKRLKASNEFFQEVLFLLSNRVPKEIKEWSDAQVRVFISRIGIKRLQDVMDLACAERKAGQDPHGLKKVEKLQERIRVELQGNHPFTLHDLPVNGRDVMETLAIGPGPQVGKVLEGLLNHVHQNPSMNDRNILMEFLKKKAHKEV